MSPDRKTISEYAILQLPSLLETGHLKPGDECYDADTDSWVPLGEYVKNIAGFSKSARSSGRSPAALEEQKSAPAGHGSAQIFLWLLVILACAVAGGAGFFAWTQREEMDSLRSRLAASEEAKAGFKKQCDEALLMGPGVVPNDRVRGRGILRDATGARSPLPGISVRLFSRTAIQAHLEARHLALTPETGTDPSQLAVHYMEDLPQPIETTTTDADGRFEIKVPEPGDYVVQTSLKSLGTGEMRLWFVSFDSRDQLNTPVDINDSNAARQFIPLLMLVDGR